MWKEHNLLVTSFYSSLVFLIVFFWFIWMNMKKEWNNSLKIYLFFITLFSPDNKFSLHKLPIREGEGSKLMNWHKFLQDLSCIQISTLCIWKGYSQPKGEQCLHFDTVMLQKVGGHCLRPTLCLRAITEVAIWFVIEVEPWAENFLTPVSVSLWFSEHISVWLHI